MRTNGYSSIVNPKTLQPKMSQGGKPRRVTFGAALLAGFAFSACSGDDDSSGPGGGGEFAVNAISVLNGSVWQINRPIRIDFSEPVDFSTVTQNTIRISNEFGVTATGVFLQPTDGQGMPVQSAVVFQPSCPILDDFSDAGFLPDEVDHTLEIFGSLAQSGVTVRSLDGDSLTEGAVVDFVTPPGLDPLTLFLDTVAGPPSPVIRGAGGVSLDALQATFLERGGDPDDRVYFQLDTDPSSPTSQFGVLPAGMDVELNRYSDTGSQVAVVIFFNQPIIAGPSNVNSEQIRFEYLDLAGDWLPVPTNTSLVANCSASGAVVRVEPIGLLPQDSNLRINVQQGFSDISGSISSVDSVSFARMTSELIDNPDLVDPNTGSDELLEAFAIGGSAPGSLEDQETSFGQPRATWMGGRLEAGFAFDGVGGPSGSFDLLVAAGDTLVLNTNNGIAVSSDGQSSQTLINGVLDLRDLTVEPGGLLTFVGTNPASILATGDVLVAGRISVNGSNNIGVETTNMTNIATSGSLGNAGGGNGGTGSVFTTQSTPRGGNGSGAFGALGFGGQGGESSFFDAGVDGRRAAGGGGGRLGGDVFYDHLPDNSGPLALCQTLIGLDAEPGRGGGAEGLGAISQSGPAAGGLVGPGPFVDGDGDNNFFGSLLTSEGEFINGELQQLWAGAGGGAGGDAVDSATFPLVPFFSDGDERGAGGGGGAGGLSILALGSIVVSSTGSITADGGHGGGGENMVGFNRVGGGSGGGSGGHIVLSSSLFVDIQGEAQGANTWYLDNTAVADHFARPLSALGGGGGAGNNNRGGATQDGPTTWRCDAIPAPRLALLPEPVPPAGIDDNCYDSSNVPLALPDLGEENGPALGAGGDGGPGIIQIHVADPASNIRFSGIDNNGAFTYGGVPDPGNPGEVFNAIDASRASAPPPLGWFSPDLAVDTFVPFFGRFSIAQSDWIPLGLARVAADGSNGQVSFRFDGTVANDTSDTAGRIMRTGDVVNQLDPLVGPDLLNGLGVTPFLDNGGLTCVLDPSGVEDIYLANTQLLRQFTIELSDSASPTTPMDFEIVAAEFVGSDNQLVCNIANTSFTMQDFVDQASGDVSASLIRHDFRLFTGSVADLYLENNQVRILFDATLRDPGTGLPSEELSFSATNPNTNGEPTSNITLLNDPNPMPPPDPNNPFVGWDFVRFRVIFDLDAGAVQNGVVLNAPRPFLDFVRLAFEFQ